MLSNKMLSLRLLRKTNRCLYDGRTESFHNVGFIFKCSHVHCHSAAEKPTQPTVSFFHSLLLDFKFKVFKHLNPEKISIRFMCQLLSKVELYHFRLRITAKIDVSSQT